MKYTLKELKCANCANKIENEINKLEEIKNVNINFTTKKLSFELNKQAKKEETITKIKKIIKEIEPEVELIEEKSDINEKQNFELPKIIVSGIIFLLGVTLNTNDKLKLILFLTSYIIIGYDIILKALKNIFKRNLFDESFLMTLATIGAFTINERKEAVAVMLFYKIGEYLQDKAVDHSRKSISALINIKPEYANVKRDKKIEKTSPEEVKIGETIIVKKGEKIPLDGIVIKGESFVNTVELTGESVLRKVKENEEVLSGMINEQNLLTLKVTKTFKNSAVSKILELVENTSSKKASTEKFITKFSKIYTPIVVIIFVLLAIIPPIIFNQPFSIWFYKALVCLVISCPCALVISVPLSYFGGIGCASKKGILIKGANYLDILNNVDTIFFDKTGTITEGVFKVTKIVNEKDYTKEEILKYCAYAEVFSNHPIATSILNEHNEKIDKEKIKNYEEISGCGIKASINDKKVLVGNTKLLDKEKVKYDKANMDGTIIYLAIDNEYCGYLIISDVIKKDSKETLKSLKKYGIKTVMLTGDNENTARTISKKINIDDYKAELLPNQKVEELENLMKNKKENQKLVFVGDGINDAPVLARADIGIAMGGIGSESAIEAADIVIMTDELSKIPTALKIAKKTKNIVVTNITLAISIKITAIILGILGIASIWGAVIADVGVTIISILNSLRCLNIKDEEK